MAKNGLIEIKPIDKSIAIREWRPAIKLSVVAQNFKAITTSGQYEAAGLLLQHALRKIKEIGENRKNITIPLDSAKKAVMDLFRGPLANLDMAQRKLKQLIVDYDAQQAAERREKERKLREKAEAEERRKKEILDRKIAEAKKEKDRKKIAELKEKKDQVFVEKPVLAEPEKPQGIHSFVDNWTAEVVNFKVLPDDFKTINSQLLNKMAKLHKGNITIPGVIFRCEKIVKGKL